MPEQISRAHETMIVALAVFQSEMIEHALSGDNERLEEFLGAFCEDFGSFAQDFKLKKRLAITPRR